MNCAICKNETDTDMSVGKENFVLCSCCYGKLIEKFPEKHRMTVFSTLCRIGQIIEENEKGEAK